MESTWESKRGSCDTWDETFCDGESFSGIFSDTVMVSEGWRGSAHGSPIRSKVRLGHSSGLEGKSQLGWERGKVPESDIPPWECCLPNGRLWTASGGANDSEAARFNKRCFSLFIAERR